MSSQKVIKRIGIWMDHLHAHLIEYTEISNKTKDLHQKTLHHRHDNNNGQNENLIHNKESQEQAGIYKTISDTIFEYHDVLLFGPTDANTELKNILREDHHFDHIKIETRSVGKMTENQEKAFVKEYFLSNQNE